MTCMFLLRNVITSLGYFSHTPFNAVIESPQENSFKALQLFLVYLRKKNLFSFLYKLKLSVFQAEHKKRVEITFCFVIEGKADESFWKNIFFPLFFSSSLVNYCKSFFDDFFLFLLTIGDFLSWAALQIPFLPSPPPPSSSISPPSMRKKSKQTAIFFVCVLFQFFSYFLFWHNSFSNIPFSHIIILYSVPFVHSYKEVAEKNHCSVMKWKFSLLLSSSVAAAVACFRLLLKERKNGRQKCNNDCWMVHER